MIKEMKKALILGGGFAGVQAAIELQKQKLFEVTLVSDRDYFYLYPISIWVPLRKIPFEDVKVSMESIQAKHHFKFILDEVVRINAAENSVECKKSELHYDYLIIAIGAEKMKHMGMENTLSICGKPELSLQLRDKMDAIITRGKGKIAIGFGGNPKDKSAVRGGPAFEFIFNIHHLLTQKGIRNKFEITAFAPMASPGERMGAGALKMMGNMFESYKINTRFGKKIKEFQSDRILFEDDSFLESDLTMFIPASAGNPIFQTSNLPVNEAGFVKITDETQVDGYANMFAIGDSAALVGPDWTAKQGHIAEVMARIAAFNIKQMEAGKPARQEYPSHLNILCVMDTGNGAAFIFRNSKKAFVIPLPIIGHWMKQGWGKYAKWTKLKKFPRLPGM